MIADFLKPLMGDLSKEGWFNKLMSIYAKKRDPISDTTSTMGVFARLLCRSELLDIMDNYTNHLIEAKNYQQLSELLLQVTYVGDSADVLHNIFEESTNKNYLIGWFERVFEVVAATDKLSDMGFELFCRLYILNDEKKFNPLENLQPGLIARITPHITIENKAFIIERHHKDSLYTLFSEPIYRHAAFNFIEVFTFKDEHNHLEAFCQILCSLPSNSLPNDGMRNEVVSVILPLCRKDYAAFKLNATLLTYTPCHAVLTVLLSMNPHLIQQITAQQYAILIPAVRSLQTSSHDYKPSRRLLELLHQHNRLFPKYVPTSVVTSYSFHQASNHELISIDPQLNLTQ